MNGMLTDDDVTRLLGEAAMSFEVPAEGPAFVLEELADATPKRPHLRKRLVRVTAVAAAVVAGTLWVQAINGGGISTKQTDMAGSAGDGRSRSAAEASGGGLAAGTTGGTTGASTWSGSSYDPQLTDQSKTALTPLSSSQRNAAGVVAPAVPGTAVPQKAPSAAPGDAFEDGARIVKTGTIGLVVSDGKVSGVVGKVRVIATNNRGYVAEERSQEYGDDPSSTLTLRVPVSAFERTVQAVRDQVKGGVGKVDTATTSGQDVTAQYADLQAQIQSLTAARNRFLTILSRANTIGETLSVQQRVDSTQLQIDRLEGQRRALAKQSDLATLTVTVGEKPKEATKADVQSGLSKSWDNAKEGFSSGVEGLVSRSGRALLVLIVAAVGLGVLRFGWRLARRRLV